MRRVKNHTWEELLPERQRHVLREILGSEEVEDMAWRKYDEGAWGGEEFEACNELRKMVCLTRIDIEGI